MTQLTAADAAWTLSTILKFQNSATASQAGSVGFLHDATATSPTTLVLHYTKPVSNVLANMQATPILPFPLILPLPPFRPILPFRPIPRILPPVTVRLCRG